MAVVVIGGHSRNIGKTSVVCSVIRALPERRWTAMKITQFGHGVCSANGEPCDCETADHTVAVSEERDRESGTDSSRYLAAGAARSLWVRTRSGQLSEAMPRIRKEISEGVNVILESNSVLRFLQPDLYAAVLSPDVEDFKESSLRYLDRADAILLSPGHRAWGWEKVSPRLVAGVPRFEIAPPEFRSEEFLEVVAQRVAQIEQKNSLNPQD